MNSPMTPRLAIFVFIMVLTCSVATGIDSIMRTARHAQQDVDAALKQTLASCRPDVIDTDTVRIYRSHIRSEALRDTAFLTLAVADERHGQPHLKAGTGLTLTRLWRLSDQRASGTLAAAAALWLLLSLMWIRKTGAVDSALVVANGCHTASVCEERDALGVFVCGDLRYDSEHHLFYAGRQELSLTPMQRTLMEMFVSAPAHRLSHQEICDRLWPRKPDASATLHTLIRRLKPVVEDAAGLHITCQRGQAYQLTDASGSLTRG